MENDFEIITFDCYGTLIDWEGGIASAFQEEASRDGLTFDAREIISAYMAVEPAVEAESYLPYREVLASVALQVAEKIGWPLAPERARFLSESVPRWQPFADTNAALERLSQRFRLGILSNIDDDLLAETRKHFIVEFDLIVTAQQVKSYKPGFAHFEEAAARLGGKRQLHAAQSYFHDVVPARKLGLPVVWVNRKSELAEEGGPLPTHEVKNVAELADLFGV